MDADRWEVGGEFGSESPDTGECEPWASNHVRFALAQHALIAIWRSLSASQPVVWVPNYFCSPVVEVLSSAGAAIRTYADDPRWSRPRWNTLTARAGDFVLAVNYFGVRDGTAWREWQAAHRGVVLIEDHTHDPVSAWARSSTADYAVASLRKTLPIPDGALAWSPAGHALPAQPLGTDWRGSSLKLKAMALKQIYLSGGDSPREGYLRLQREGEAALLATSDLRMSPWTETLLGSGVPRASRARREANVRQVLDLTKGHPDFRPLFDHWPEGHCPFNAILVFRDAETRDAVRTRLLQNRIFPAVHWESSSADPRIDELSRRILTVPVDQRYGSEDVGRVASWLTGNAIAPVAAPSRS